MKTYTICNCDNFKFPHRMMPRCDDGWRAVEKVFEQGDECVSCPFHKKHPGDAVEPPSRHCNLMNEGRYDPSLCLGFSRFVYETRRKTQSKADRRSLEELPTLATDAARGNRDWVLQDTAKKVEELSRRFERCVAFLLRETNRGKSKEAAETVKKYLGEKV